MQGTLGDGELTVEERILLRIVDGGLDPEKMISEDEKGDRIEIEEEDESSEEKEDDKDGSHEENETQRQCGSSEFWNSDLDVCVPCASCKQYPKTPSCNTCKPVDDTADMWKLAAITSFSVLALVLVGAALIIGVMVHRRKSHKRPLRGKIPKIRKKDEITFFRQDSECNTANAACCAAVRYPDNYQG
ncbi:hypothetical protein Q8A73_021385 [Channa argus]|nr:hypothetical protein Q8A73_021385 [Channa argus]